ncbi:30S ribosomal protein S16 [Candidatus Parcubacteria bacterium]|nr:30S ribosomal protein S16 [Candidatus Parcubacteria bacterium]
MLTIRLQRVGRKNTPHFRVVVTDSKNPPKGKFLEVVGSYDPKTKQATLKADRIKEHLAHGTTCSETVWNMLVREKVVEGAKRAVKSSRYKLSAAPAALAESTPATPLEEAAAITAE